VSGCSVGCLLYQVTRVLDYSRSWELCQLYVHIGAATNDIIIPPGLRGLMFCLHLIFIFKRFLSDTIMWPQMC